MQQPSNQEAPPRDHRRASWLGAVFLALAIVLAGWSVWLGFALPRRTAAQHWDLAWSGFDVGLAVVLGLTAAALFRRSAWILTAAGASAALLVCDTWFDVITSRPSTRGLAIVEAVLVELPLAALCVWIAVRSERAIESAADLRAFGRRLRSLGSHGGGDPSHPPR